MELRAKNFIENRLMSRVSFWKPVAKANTKSVTQKKGKENHIIPNSDRQLWSRLAIASKTRDIDFCDVLSYELSPIPLALYNLNGTLRKPNKASLLHELEMENQGVPMLPDSSRKMVTVLDMTALVQSIRKGKKPRSGS